MKLTPFAKFFVTVVILAVVGYAGGSGCGRFSVLVRRSGGLLFLLGVIGGCRLRLRGPGTERILALAGGIRAGDD